MKRSNFFNGAPKNNGNKQVTPHEKIEGPELCSDLAEKLYDSELPVMSHDEVWSKLTDSENELVKSLENGGQYEGGESYQISEYQKRNSYNKN